MNTNLLSRLSGIAAVFCAFFSSANLVPAGAEERPKISLVLSGGGARGTAHVGALKALEELRIPVDSIAANSMGSIIGGLYASGMSPEELQDWFEHADWHALFDDRPERKWQAYRTKVEDLNLVQNVEIGIRKNEIRLPEGLVAGGKLLSTLRRFALPVADIDHFDDLAVPFRAVATDLNTGEMVVFDHGDLPLAIRASMSVPGVFTPVHHQGKMLVDGLAVSNLPISVAKQMKGDVVIAIDVGELVEPMPADFTALDVTGQMMKIMMAANDTREKALLTADDTYVHVDLGNASPADFAGGVENIAKGYDAVMAVRDRLSRYAVSESEYRALVQKQRRIRDREIDIEFIRFTDTGRIPERTVRQRLRTKVGEQLDLAKLERDLGAINQLGNYNLIDGRIVEEDGVWGLEVDTYEKPLGPNYLKVGFLFSSDFESESEMSSLLSFRMRELNELGGEIWARARIGDDEELFFEYYQPLEYSRTFFVAPYVHGQRVDDLLLTADGNVLGFRGNQIGWGLDGGFRIANAGEFRIGYLGGAAKVDRIAGGEGLDLPGEFNLGKLRSSLAIDTVDSIYFPTKGIRMQASIEMSDTSFGADENYAIGAVSFLSPLTKGDYTIVPFANVSGRIGDDRLPIYDQVGIGGFGQLGTSNTVFQDQYAANTGAYFYKKMGALPPGLGTGWYLGGSVEMGNVFANSSDIALDEFLLGGSAFLGLETRLGSLYFGSAMTEGFDPTVFLFLGQPF